jgi:hypothetical protein
VVGALQGVVRLAVATIPPERGLFVVVIAWDGGFQLNIQELQTAARNRFAGQDRHHEQWMARDGASVSTESLAIR